jgi:hypothetical protein
MDLHKHGHDHEHKHGEFAGESPAVETPTRFKTGEKVNEDGAYVCINCTEARKPPMVNMTKGQMIPVCASCGPLSRWQKI